MTLTRRISLQKLYSSSAKGKQACGPGVTPKDASGNKGGFCQPLATGKDSRGTSELSDIWQAAFPL